MILYTPGGSKQKIIIIYYNATILPRAPLTCVVDRHVSRETSSMGLPWVWNGFSCVSLFLDLHVPIAWVACEASPALQVYASIFIHVSRFFIKCIIYSWMMYADYPWMLASCGCFSAFFQCTCRWVVYCTNAWPFTLPFVWCIYGNAEQDHCRWNYSGCLLGLRGPWANECSRDGWTVVRYGEILDFVSFTAQFD